jgi:hypothetical protein
MYLAKVAVASVLEQTVGKYIDGLNAEALNVSILSGMIKLTNLSLKRGAIDELHLPVMVTSGSIGRIAVSVPWMNLSSKPVTVEIADVELVTHRREGWDWDLFSKQAKTSALDAKQAALELLELGRVQSGEMMDGAEAEGGGGVIEKITVMILENLIVRISNVHFRFVEEGVMVAGARLEHLNLETTDETWNSGFFKKKAGGVAYKSIDLNRFSVYCDVDRNSLTPQDEPKFILMPTSARLLVKKTPQAAQRAEGAAPVHACLQCAEIALSLSCQQYKGFVQEAQLFGELMQEKARFQSKKIRPKRKIADSLMLQAPARRSVIIAWWKYAAQAVMGKLKDLYTSRTGYGERYTWKTYARTCKDRRRYISLWKRTQEGATWLKKLTVPEEQELLHYEQTLRNESVIQFRVSAQAEFDSTEKEKAVGKESSKKGSWFSSWTFSSPAPGDSAAVVKMTEQEVHALRSAIDETEVPEWNVRTASADAVVHIEACLPRVALTLEDEAKIQSTSLDTDGFYDANDGHGDTSVTAEKLASVSMLGGKYTFTRFGDRDSVTAEVGDFVVDDLCTHGTKFPSLVRYNKVVDSGVGAMAFVSDPEEANPETPALLRMEFISFKFDQGENSLTDNEGGSKQPTDFALKVFAEPVDLVLLPHLMKRVLEAFQMPQEVDLQHAASMYDDIVAYAGDATVDKMDHLQSSFEARSFWAINVDIKAPRILLVQDVLDERSPMLLLDLGKLSFRSEPPARDEANSAASQFDTFVVSLKDVQAVTTTPSATSTEVARMSLLEKFSIDTNVQTRAASAMDKSGARLVVRSKLPLLSFQVDSERLRVLARLQAALADQLSTADDAAEAAAGGAAGAAAGGSRTGATRISSSSSRSSATSSSTTTISGSGSGEDRFGFELAELRVSLADAHGAISCLHMGGFTADVKQQADGGLVASLKMGTLRMSDELHLQQQRLRFDGQLGSLDLISCADSTKLVEVEATKTAAGTTALSVAMCHVHFEWLPRTVRRLRCLLELLALSERSASCSSSPPLPSTGTGTVAVQGKTMPAAPAGTMRVKASIAALSICFNREEQDDDGEQSTTKATTAAVMTIKMEKAETELATDAAGQLQLSAKVTDLHCTDASKPADQLAHPHFFSVQQGQNLVDVQYSTSVSSVDGTSSAEAEVGLGAARFVCVPALVMGLVEYVNKDVVGAMVADGGRAQNGDAASGEGASSVAMQQPMAAQQPMRVVVRWSSASIFVPSGVASREGVEMDIAHVDCEYKVQASTASSTTLTGSKTCVMWRSENPSSRTSATNERLIIMPVNWRVDMNSTIAKDSFRTATNDISVVCDCSELGTVLHSGDLLRE